jgi:RNA polymerase sigma factor (sigma-70 family)
VDRAQLEATLALPGRRRIMAPRNDYRLLDLWRRGDQAAGKELFERYFHMLHHFFASEMGLGHPELVVETFRACLKGHVHIPRHMSFRTHLLANAHRVLGARHRRHPPRKHMPLTAESEDTDAPESSEVTDGFDELADTYSRSDVITPRPASPDGFEERRMRALHRLPGEARVLIELQDIEHVSERELAELLDMSSDAVTRALHHARWQLEKAMKGIAPYGIEAPPPGRAPQVQQRDRIQIVLDCDIAQLDLATCRSIVEEARAETGDTRLSITSIWRGSVIMEFDIAEDAAAMLEMLFKSGDLEKLAGLRIIRLWRGEQLLPVAAVPEEAQIELYSFLVSAFTSDELRRFVHGLPGGALLAAALPGSSVSLSHLAFEVVGVLARHGLRDETLFESLEAERPHRRDEICRIRQRFAGPADEGPDSTSN